MKGEPQRGVAPHAGAGRAPQRALGARALAAQVLLEVASDPHRRSPDALSAALSARPGLDPRERALTTELVYGCLRWRRRLDHGLGPWVHQGLDALEPVARTLLRLGAYQLRHLDRVPAPVAVSATQDAARQLGAGRLTRLLNGVLRRVAEAREELPAGPAEAALGVRTSLPDWVVAELGAAYGADAEAEGLALRERATTTVRPGRRFGGAQACVDALASEGFTAEPGPYGTLVVRGAGDPFATAAFGAGAFVPQDPASLAVVDLVGDVEGLRVLDLCAGRGLKATALAERGARVLAVDISPGKLDALRGLAARLGVAEGIDTWVADAAADGGELGDERFARVLVDAPCTGLGTLRRHPEIAWRRTPEDLRALTGLQARLLARGAAQLAPGGELVYAVCSFARAEGEVATPPGLVEVERLDLRPSSGLDAFQARRFRRPPS